ncbi:MAG: hypothetical protein JWQ80_2735 [Massilia sp.]|nr:hypothetical protein [Massilia sp.]
MNTRTIALALCLLGAAAPGRALPPPRPPACVPAGAAVTIGVLEAILAGKGDSPLRDCAVNDLAARGAAAVPVAVRMLGAGDSDSAMLALALLSALGPTAQAALPALMDQVRTPSPALHLNPGGLYDAVGALGAAGGPAIPLLIARSRAPYYRYYAVGALGKLGKYDAGRVVPHLVSTLEGREGRLLPLDTSAVLGALADIGKGARAALPATLAALERAKAAGESMDASAAIRALLALAEPGESIPVLVGLFDHPMLAYSAVEGLALIGPAAASAAPALIDKLNRSREEPHMPDRIVSALAAIGPELPAVQQQLLIEATQYQRWTAAYALAHGGPLPFHFAAALAAALAKKPGDVFLGIALKNVRRGPAAGTQGGN